MLGADKEILSFILRYQDRPAPDQAFNGLAIKIFRFQFARNKNYRKFCLLEKKTPQNVKNWDEIPAMPAAGFKELVLSTFPLKKTRRIFKTSGTSIGRPGAHFFDTLKLYEASILPPFQKFLLSDGRALAYYFLMSPPGEAPHSSLSYMMGVANRRFAGNRGKYYVKNGEAQYENLARDLRGEKKPVILLSTAFALKGFLDALSARPIRLRPGSRVMETGGFKGRTGEISKEALYRACGRYLGIQRNYCVSEYGMTELSSQCYSKGDRALFQFRKRALSPFLGPAWMRTFVIDPKTGKEAKKGSPGLLRHFDLANRGSVLAVQTEDRGRAVGDGFELLGRAPGSELRGCSLSYEKFLSG